MVSTPGTMLTPILTPEEPPSSSADMNREPMPPTRTGRMGLALRSLGAWGTISSSFPYSFAVKRSISRVLTILPTTAPSRPTATDRP